MKCGNSNDVIYKEVVIIGNGPSGIALSFMLSGNLPQLVSTYHPDEMLSMRLRNLRSQSLLNEDLGNLAAGLEGRSTNPVSLLLDALLHPSADVGLEMEPLVEFKRDGIEIDHVVLGNGPPGGSWHKMDPYILTLSLGSWMSLPGRQFTSNDSPEKRAYAKNVANYYVDYVKEMQLSNNFVNDVKIASVKPVKYDDNQKSNTGCLNEDGKLEEKSVDFCGRGRVLTCLFSNVINYLLSKSGSKFKNKRPIRKAELCQVPDKKMLKYNDLEEEEEDDFDSKSINFYCDSTDLCDSIFDNQQTFNENRLDLLVPYSFQNNFNYDCDLTKQSNWLIETINTKTNEKLIYCCKYLVLANGASDLPNRLEFTNKNRNNQDPDWLFHDLRSLELHLDALDYERNRPILVVGAGLSAADAVIALRGRNIPVVHVFRNKSADFNRQLPENMYPEYHEVHQMMKDQNEETSTYPLYTAYPEYTLTCVDSNTRTVTLTSKTGTEVDVKVLCAIILIGSRPDLNFFPNSLNLGVKKELAIDSKTNPIDINTLTHSVNGFENLFAIGPLAGDNFVRFIPGGALAVVSELYKRNGYCL